MKIYQALFLAAAVARHVSANTTKDALSSFPSKNADWTHPNDATGRPDGKKPQESTRPDGVTGHPDGCKEEESMKPSEATCKMEKAKTLSKACGMQLAKACHDANMGFVTGPPEGEKPQESTRPDGVTGRPDGCKEEESVKPSEATCKMEKAKSLSMACGMQLAKACHDANMGFVTGRPEGEKPKHSTRPDGVTGRPKPKDSTRPDGVTGRPSKPVGDKPKARPNCQTAEGLDARAIRYCCFKGMFTGDGKCPDGDKNRMPAKCTKGYSTTMAAATDTNSILDEVKKGLDCRPIRTINKGEEDQEDSESKEHKPQAEDPRRNTQALVEKAKDLSATGKKCVSNLKRAIEAVKTQVQQWKGDPTLKPRKDDDTLEKDTVADTFYDAVEIAVGVEKLYKDFDKDNIGSAAKELLPAKEGDDGAPKQCKAEWEAYKEELSELVEDFKKLPSKFKEDKAKMVQIALKDIDLGDVEWANEQNVCSFSNRLVTKMKEVQQSLQTQLQHIRGTLCTKGSKLAAGPKVGALARCLREKRKSNPEDADANNEVYKRIRTKTNKIFDQIQSKCVAKPKDGDKNAEPVKPSTKTKRIIGMRIKNACKSAEDKQTCKDRVAAKIKEAVKAKNPDAEVEVSVTDSSADGRGRRLLEGVVEAQVTITETGAQHNPDYEEGVVAALGTTDVEVTSDSTEGTETITPPAQVNMNIDDLTIPASTPKPLLRTAVSAGSAARVAMGAAAAVFVTLVSVLL